MLSKAPRIQRTVTRQIANLSQTFFVRKALDDDRVLLFADLFEAGQEVPPIEITPEGEVIDGRHRIAALEFLDRTEVACVIVQEAMSHGELILRAFTANCGGAKPPTRADIYHTIELLILEGVPLKRIIEGMPFPVDATKAYIKVVQVNMKRANMRRAIAAIADKDMTIVAAAEKFGVNEDELRAELKGNKKKRAPGLAVIKSNLSNEAKGTTNHRAAVLRRTIQEFGEGTLPEKTARAIFDHVEHLIRQSQKSFNGWKTRLQAAITAVKEAKNIE
jgi:hypothetical protein